MKGEIKNNGLDYHSRDTTWIRCTYKIPMKSNHVWNNHCTFKALDLKYHHRECWVPIDADLIIKMHLGSNNYFKYIYKLTNTIMHKFTTFRAIIFCIKKYKM